MFFFILQVLYWYEKQWLPRYNIYVYTISWTSEMGSVKFRWEVEGELKKGKVERELTRERGEERPQLHELMYNNSMHARTHVQVHFV